MKNSWGEELENSWEAGEEFLGREMKNPWKGNEEFLGKELENSWGRNWRIPGEGAAFNRADLQPPE